MQAVLQHVLHISGVHLGLVCDGGDNLAVVIFHAQLVRQTLADLAPAAAAFTAYSDNTHIFSLPFKKNYI